MNGLRHIPMDWRYREVPDWAWRSVGGEDFHRYCEWLAHHLRSRDFPMNPAQARYAASWTDATPEGIAIDLADGLGYLTWDRVGLEDDARHGTPYAEIERRERGDWQKDHDADPDVVEPFDEWKTQEDEYVRICQETRELDALWDEIVTADIGIRPLLALAVKQCATDQEATEIVKLFYGTFNEAASK